MTQMNIFSYLVSEECFDLCPVKMVLVGQPGDGVSAEGHASGSLSVPRMYRLHGLTVAQFHHFIFQTLSQVLQ